MPEPTIAEIIAEARRLREAVTDALVTHPSESALDKIRAHQAFCALHFSRLAAVAEAAVARDAAEQAWMDGDATDEQVQDTEVALRALLRGEKGGANG